MTKKMVYSFAGVFLLSVVCGYVFVGMSRSGIEKKESADEVKMVSVSETGDEETYYSNAKPVSGKGEEKSGTYKSDGGDEKYIFRDYEGKLAVYRQVAEDDVFLYYLTNVEVSQLPESDRESIRRGILVESREEMLTLLEDFGS